MKQLNDAIVRAGVSGLTLFVVIVATFCGPGHASEALQPGSQYKIIGPVYLSAIYRNLNNRQLNKQMAFGSLTAVQFAGPETAFQRMVPLGTIMTIIAPAPKRAPFPFIASQYFVRLVPIPTDLPSEIDIILELNRGIEGSLDGLNPELFSRQ